MEIHPSAYKHGFTDEDILHALEHVHIDYDVVDADPPRTSVFGLTPSLTLVEMILLHDVPGGRVIHCQKARPHELNKALQARNRY